MKSSKAEAARWYGCPPSAAQDLTNCRILRRRAEEDDAHAQFSLGRVYALQFRPGIGVNSAEAARWYRKAAEQGDVQAESELGLYYELGLGGLTRDYSEAFHWYRKAADRGDTNARYRLADLYFSGTGVEQNFAEAARLYGCPKPAEDILAACREVDLDDLTGGEMALLDTNGCEAKSEGSAVDLNGDGSPEYLVCCHEALHGPCFAVLIGQVTGRWRVLSAEPGLEAFPSACADFIVLESRHSGYHDVCLPHLCTSGTGYGGKPCTPKILQFDGTSYREPGAAAVQPR